MSKTIKDTNAKYLTDEQLVAISRKRNHKQRNRKHHYFNQLDLREVIEQLNNATTQLTDSLEKAGN
jgi:transcription initiation factor IIE alpha subunit